MNGTQETHQAIQVLRSTSPYILAHRGRSFVLCLEGEALLEDNFPLLLQDLVLLNSLGIRLVLVYGVTPQWEQLLQARKSKSRFHEGLRITDTAALECLPAAAAQVHTRLEAGLSGGAAGGASGGTARDSARQSTRTATGNYLLARPRGVHQGMDYLHTGQLQRVDAAALGVHLNAGAIVLIPPLGYSPFGESFYLDPYAVASQCAVALGADKQILLIPEAGVLESDGTLIRTLNLEQAQQFPHPSPALEAAQRGCAQGVPRCHLVSYRDNGALLEELFTQRGAGTLVRAQDYDAIRQANPEDLAAIHALILPLQQDGTLLPQHGERLEQELYRFSVIERDGAVVGCAALYPWEQAMEIACFAVHPDFQERRHGRDLLQHLEERARGEGQQRLFVLTTQAEHWFRVQGFSPAQPDALPQARQAAYEHTARHARILVKDLQPGGQQAAS